MRENYLWNCKSRTDHVRLYLMRLQVHVTRTDHWMTKRVPKNFYVFKCFWFMDGKTCSLRNGCKKRELKRKRGSEEGEDDKHSFLFFILTQQMMLDSCWHLRHDPFKDSDHCNLAILSHPITCPFIPLFVYFVVFEICVEGKFLSLIMSQDTFWMAWNADELSKLRNE